MHIYLGTDDQGRRRAGAAASTGSGFSVLFGLVLDRSLFGHRRGGRRGAGLFRRLGPICSFQRLIEIWTSVPTLSICC
jgi:ABC-type microcin C transport system permease subunit YejE